MRISGRDIFIFDIFVLATAVLSVAMYYLLKKDIESNRKIFTNSEKMSAHSISKVENNSRSEKQKGYNTMQRIVQMYNQKQKPTQQQDSAPHLSLSSSNPSNSQRPNALGPNAGHIVSMQSLAEGGQNIPTNITRAMAYNNKPMGYNIDFQTRPSPINIKNTGPISMGMVANAVRDATKGDGLRRDVFVDGSKVPKEMVDLAMFNNHEFYNHDQFEFAVQETPNMFDTSSRIPQKSMFGPIKPVLGLGTDIYTPTTVDTESLRIAGKGGRF